MVRKHNFLFSFTIMSLVAVYAFSLSSAPGNNKRLALPSDAERVSQRTMGSAAQSSYQLENAWSAKKSPLEWHAQQKRNNTP